MQHSLQTGAVLKRAAAALSETGQDHAAQTPFHHGLPEGWNRDRFRQLCERYARIQGCSAQCVTTLGIIIDFVPPTAFTNPLREPLCYAKQETLDHGRGLSTRALRRHEAQLEALGLLTRRLDANGGRSSKKARGLVLTPALLMIEEMLEVIETDHAAREAHARLRGDRSTLLRHIKATLEVLSEAGQYRAALAPHLAAFSAWPRADRLHGMSHEALASHVETARDMLMALGRIAQNPAFESGQPDSRVRSHIQDQIEDKILSCNSYAVKKGPSAKAEETGLSSAPPNGCALRSENEHVDPSRGDKPKDASAVPEADMGESSGLGQDDTPRSPALPRVSNSLIYEIASPELRMHIDIANGGAPNPNPTLYAIEVGVLARLGEHGTNLSAWHEAIDQLGLMSAIVAGILTDARITDPRQAPVASPGGYLRGMIRKAAIGELNLIGGLMGLMARRAKEEEQNNG